MQPSYICKKNNLRQSVTILILLALVAQIFTKPFLALDYFSNTAAYARNCVNKAKPKLHCNGKCQLMKKMKQEDNKDKQSAEQKTSKEEVLSSKHFFITLEYFASNTARYYPRLTPAAATHMPRSFFHPPGEDC